MKFPFPKNQAYPNLWIAKKLSQTAIDQNLQEDQKFHGKSSLIENTELELRFKKLENNYTKNSFISLTLHQQTNNQYDDFFSFLKNCFQTKQFKYKFFERIKKVQSVKLQKNEKKESFLFFME